MIERLPYYYRKSKVVKDFYDAIQRILDKTNADIADADRRLFIITTDNFDLHEKDVSLTAAPELDMETRHARVISRLQASRVLTVEALKELVTLYEKSGADVGEIYDKYAFILEFANREGAPENIMEILAAIEEVKPAHLRIGLGFTRNPVGAVALCGVIQSRKEIMFDAADAILRMTVGGVYAIGGRIQKLKTVQLDVAVRAIRTGIRCKAHCRTRRRSYHSLIVMRFFVNIITLVFIAALGTGVGGISHRRTRCRSNYAVIVMLRFVRVVTDIRFTAVVTSIRCKAHCRTSRNGYGFRIVMSCREFQNCAAHRTSLRFGTRCRRAGCVTCRRFRFALCSVTVLAVVLQQSLTVAGSVSYFVTVIPFVTCWVFIIRNVGVTAVSAGVSGKSASRTRRSSYLLTIIVFSERR